MPGTVLKAINQWFSMGCQCVAPGHLEIFGDTLDCLEEQGGGAGRQSTTGI